MRSRPRRSTRCGSSCAGAVDEILFGDRPDPLDAATRVVGRLGDDPVLALRAIREALVLPYASLWAGGVELASSGTAVTHVRRLGLQLGDDEVGEIVVGLRPGDLTLSAGDERVLRIVAPLLAQTLRARALADDLQSSRGQAIAAIEEERRRLQARPARRARPDPVRHRLHRRRRAQHPPRPAGLGRRAPAQPARRRSHGRRRDPSARLRHAAAGARRARARPGAPAACRDRPHLGREGHARRVDATDALPDLPAAVETAAYRIALEALTNAARHSGSDTAELRIGLRAGGLSVTVHDDGRNGHPWEPGVGISSMRERAAEVGGTLTVADDGEGFAVQALLPLR